MQIEIVILAILGAWLFGVTVALFALLRFFRKLTKGVKDADLRTVLEKILAREEANRGDVKKLESEIARVVAEGKFHVQKVGLVRFNPFKDTGGDHSFTLALLDGKDSGVVLTGLHTRERTRIYMKDIKNGKSSHELSEEERKAIVAAQRG